MAYSNEGGTQNTEGQVLSTGAPVQTIKLADGQDWKLKPINLNMLIALESKFGKVTDDMAKSPSFAFLRYVLFLRLQPFDLDLTEDKVGELVDTNVMKELPKLLEV